MLSCTAAGARLFIRYVMGGADGTSDGFAGSRFICDAFISCDAESAFFIISGFETIF